MTKTGDVTCLFLHKLTRAGEIILLFELNRKKRWGFTLIKNISLLVYRLLINKKQSFTVHKLISTHL